MSGGRAWMRASAMVGALASACAVTNAPPSAEARSLPPAMVTSSVPARAAKPAAIGARNVYSVKRVWSAVVGGFGKAATSSRGVQRVAVATDATTQLFDLWTGKRKGQLATCRDVVRGGLTFVGDSLYVVCKTRVEAFHAKKRTKATPIGVAKPEVTAMAVAGSRMALGHRDGVVRVYSFEGAPTIEIVVPGPPVDVKSLALSPDGSRVAVAWVQGSVWWWETKAPGVPHRLVRHTHESDTLAFSTDAGLLAEEGEPKQTTIWSFGSPPKAITKIRNGDWVKRLHFTRDAKWLVRGGSDGLELAEIDGPKRIALDTTGEVEDVGIDELGAGLVAVDRKGVVTVWMPR